MKRKLSALLAIVLVVVMVFPTAVFVGADTVKITAKYTGVDSSEEKDVPSTGISIPKGAEYTVKVTIPTGYTATYTKNNDNGAVKFSGENGNFTVVGSIVGETASISVEATKGTEKLTLNIPIACVAIALDESKVSVTNVIGGEGVYSNGNFKCATGTEITGATLSATLNNGKPATFKNIKVGTSTSDMGEKVKVTTADNGGTLYISYEVEEVSGSFEAKEVTLIVSGTDVSNVIAVAKSNKQHNAESLTVSEFISEYVTVKADVNSSQGTFDNATITVKNGTTTMSDSDTIDNSNIGNLTFTVSYQGVDGMSTYKVSDFVTLNLVVPASVQVDLSGLTKKTYVAGEKITSTKGITVTAYDKDENEITSSSISVGAITFNAFEYGKDTVTGTVVVNGKTYNFTADLKTAGITVEQRKVTGIEKDSSSTMKTSYKSGETLDMTGLKIKVSYNYGDSKVIDYSNFDFTCSPKNGATLTENTTLLVVYTDPDTNQDYKCEIALTVDAAAKTLASAELVYGYTGKTSYYVGETFDKSVFKVKLTYTDKSTETKLLKDLYCGTYTFTSSDVGTDKTMTMQVSTTSSGTKVDLKISGITVKNRSEISSISVDYIGDNKMDSETSKYKFMLGETPAVEDFEINVVYKDGSKAVRRINSENVDYTSSSSAEKEAAKSSATATLEDEGLKITFTITPTKVAEDTTSLKIVYTEKATTAINGKYYSDTETVSMPITVTIPECIVSYYTSSSYSSLVSKPYEDFYEALKDVVAEHADKAYRGVTVTLYKDVELKYQVSVEDSLTIDLNGHDIQLSSHSVLRVYSKSSYSNVVITFENSSKDDARICYTKDDDEDIILGYNDTFTIDKDTDSDVGKYDVTISSVKNGTVTGPKEISHGHDAQFEVKPADGYTVGSISVKQGTSKKTYTKDKDNENIFTVEDVQGDLTITVTFEEKAWDNPFTDVYKSATYYKSIQFVYENGLFSGMSATKFEPDTTMTRAMFVTVLGRLANVDTSKYTKAPDFTDVSTTDASISYAIPYIQWAVENGLIEGYGNGKFGPKDNITHIQMYVLMQRYASYIEHKNTSATSTNIPANDVADIPTWSGAYEAVQYAAKYDFLVTSSNRITPNGDAKRSELAMLLEKFCDKVLEWNK